MSVGVVSYKHIAPLEQRQAQKSAAVFAVRRANYTHRRKGVFNGKIIEHLNGGGNVRSRTKDSLKITLKECKAH